MLLRGKKKILRRSAIVIVLLTICIAIVSCSCSSRDVINHDKSGLSRNVVLISIDTLRAGHLGSYGYSRSTSPVLDVLAERGVRFSKAFTSSSWTLPAHVSIMTSLYPHQHNVQKETQSLSEQIPTLAEILSKQGFETGGFISWFYVSSRYGFNRGFDTFEEFLPQNQDLSAYRRAEEIMDHAIHWLRTKSRSSDQPLFLFIHLFDPHMDYNPPPPYDELFVAEDHGDIDGSYQTLKKYIKGLHTEPARIETKDLQKIIALYDGEIRYVDTQVGRLLEALSELSLDASTLVIVTSDHGEEHNDHGSMEGHQWTLYDEVLHVPLILRIPGGPEGRIVDSLVEITDIAPTILHWLEMDSPKEFEGRSLLEIMENSNAVEDRKVCSIIARFNSMCAVRSQTHKLILTGDTGTNAFGIPISSGYELYDMQRDPEERVNIFSMDSPVAMKLMRHLDSWLRIRKVVDENAEGVTFSEEELERLRSLGYIE